MLLNLMRAYQMYLGLKSGNIGDDFMVRAFWDQLPGDLQLTVAVSWVPGTPRESYPESHCYTPATNRYPPSAFALGTEVTRVRDLPVLLVGTTLVATEYRRWPLWFLLPRLQHFHRLGVPVDAVGVGVDHLDSLAAKLAFRSAFKQIRSWTVRSVACRDSLLSLGVGENRVRVAADLAWLYKQHFNLKDWAGSFWRDLGIEPSKPLLVVNVVNARNEPKDLKARLAGALDHLSTAHNLQVAFFCNETRGANSYDFSAAQSVARLMRQPAVIVPNLYFSPDEVLALLSYAAVGIGQRYHFLLECALADVVPIAIPRAEKMKVLAKELRLAVPGSTDSLESASLVAAVESVLSNGDRHLHDLRVARNQLKLRARDNFAFLKQLLPYKGKIRFRSEDVNDEGTANYASPQTSSDTHFGKANT